LVFINEDITREIALQGGEANIARVSAQGTPALEKAGYTIIRQMMGTGNTSLVPDSADKIFSLVKC